MSDNVELTYKRTGETYEGTIGAFKFEGFTFAEMMMHAHRFLVNVPAAGLTITRTDRPGLLPAKLEQQLLEQLRNDPLAYIKANTIVPRVIDLRGERTSALAAGEKYNMPRTGGLRHGLGTLADAFGETLYTRARAYPHGWRFEHPGTGRWADLATVEHWLETHDTEIYPVDEKSGWLLVKTEQLLNTAAERFYYPREWNEFGSWITKEQLRVKLEQFRKDKSNVTR